MAGEVSVFGSISPRVGVHASQLAIATARRKQIISRTAVHEPIPKKKGMQVDFRVWDHLAPATRPIQGSQTPSAGKHSIQDISATLEIFGNWLPLPKYVEDTIEDRTMAKASDVLGYNIGDTYETLDFLTLRQGSNSYYAGGKTARTQVVGAFDLNDLRRCVADLESDDVPMITDLVSPSIKIGTTPIEEAYLVFVHSHLDQTVRDLAGFVPRAKYAQDTKVLDGELGSCENMRFIRWNYAKPWLAAGDTIATGFRGTSNTDVYPVFILGKEAWGTSELKGTEFNKVLIANAKPTAGDELGQRGSAGWLGYHVSTILQEDHMIRLETAAKK